MKKFVFKLQSLLNVKLTLEQQAKAELAVASARVMQFEDELNRQLSKIESERFRYRQRLDNGTSPGELALFSGGFRAMQEHLEATEKKLQVAEDEKARVQRRVVEAMSERKMLEKLKEKQRLEYLDEVRREDAKTIDDFLSSTIAMRQNSAPKGG